MPSNILLSVSRGHCDVCLQIVQRPSLAPAPDPKAPTQAYVAPTTQQYAHSDKPTQPPQPTPMRPGAAPRGLAAGHINAQVPGAPRSTTATGPRPGPADLGDAVAVAPTQPPPGRGWHSKRPSKPSTLSHPVAKLWRKAGLMRSQH